MSDQAFGELIAWSAGGAAVFCVLGTLAVLAHGWWGNRR
jgi:Tfp pilus assembly protein PilO